MLIFYLTQKCFFCYRKSSKPRRVFDSDSKGVRNGSEG